MKKFENVKHWTKNHKRDIGDTILVVSTVALCTATAYQFGKHRVLKDMVSELDTTRKVVRSFERFAKETNDALFALIPDIEKLADGKTWHAKLLNGKIWIADTIEELDKIV